MFFKQLRGLTYSISDVGNEKEGYHVHLEKNSEVLV